MGPLFSALLVLPGLLLAGLLLWLLARRLGRCRAWGLGAGAGAGLLAMALCLAPLVRETLNASWQIAAYALALLLGAGLGAAFGAAFGAWFGARLPDAVATALATARARRSRATDPDR